MTEYDLLKGHISNLKDAVRFLYVMDLEGNKVAEIVLTGRAIDSVNHSIERLEALREEIERNEGGEV